MFILFYGFLLHAAPNPCTVSTLTYRYKKSGWRPKCKINTIIVSIQVIIQNLVPIPACLSIKYIYLRYKKVREVDTPGLNCKHIPYRNKVISPLYVLISLLGNSTIMMYWYTP